MKCIVAGCDTDENVVSYTSVFFVNFPTDADVQVQWFNLLAIVDDDQIRALISGQAKVCSCHFAEDSFGYHPVYGYRSLLPKAVPTIFPAKLASETLPDANQEQEDDPTFDYCFICSDDTPHADHTHHAPKVGEVANVEELDLVDDLGTVLTGEVARDPEPDEELVEEIGIEYANGKYYFLKLEPTAATVHDKTDTPSSYGADVENHELSGADQLKQLVASIKLDGSNVPDASDGEAAVNNVVELYLDGNQLKFGEAGLLVEQEKIDDDVQERTESVSVGRPEEDNGNWYNESEASQDEGHDKNVPSSEEAETDNEYSFDVEVDEKGQIVYEIEALDEVSICGDTVRVREDRSGGQLDKAEAKVKMEAENRFFCPDCGKGFRFKSGLMRHDPVHTKEKRFRCEHCSVGFSQKTNLEVHMRQHTGKRPQKKHSCQICEKKFYRQSELELHMVSHLRRYPHTCPICTERYSNLTNFYNHFRVEHRNEMTLPELIDRFSESGNAMVISEKEPENIRHADGRFGCALCGKTFKKEMLLIRHKRRMHVKIFPCPHCPRKFPYKSLLKKHLPTHTREKPFPCPHCRRSYTQRINLKVHTERKHRDLLPKHEFAQPYRGENDADNERNEDGTKAKRVYDCAQCGKLFPRKSSLITHLEGHGKATAPVTSDCDLCGISLCSSAALIRHRWRVHGARSKTLNTITNLDLRNVPILSADKKEYVEIDDQDIIVEEVEIEA